VRVTAAPARLLPREATRFGGPSGPVVFLAAFNVVATARSLVHILAPDSGAQSIASMDIRVKGGPNIIALLGQWGGGQLLESMLIWTVLWKYRGLVPLMLAAVTLEQGLRVAIGQRKPLETEHAPPGALSRGVLPLAAAALAWSLSGRGPRREEFGGQPAAAQA
jgi:hypothetical protein